MTMRIASASSALVLALLVCAGSPREAAAQAPAAAQPATTAPANMPGGAAPRPRAPGYLGAANVPNHATFLPPPPAVESPLGQADVAIFEVTRKLEGGPRWQLATSDDRLGAKTMLGNFSCAVGVDLAAAETPAISHVLARAGADLFPIIGASKDAYQRPRPFVTEEGPVCITPSEEFAKSGSYPSGHAASGWLHTLLLAEIDSANAGRIVNRGRAFGESRVVCGVHYLSDVEGGRLAATTVVAALHGVTEFEADMDAARAELAALRSATAAKPAAAACEVEGKSLTTPW